jgi:hypothetical protein
MGSCPVSTAQLKAYIPRHPHHFWALPVLLFIVQMNEWMLCTFAAKETMRGAQPRNSLLGEINHPDIQLMQAYGR